MINLKILDASNNPFITDEGIKNLKGLQTLYPKNNPSIKEIYNYAFNAKAEVSSALS